MQADGDKAAEPTVVQHREGVDHVDSNNSWLASLVQTRRCDGAMYGAFPMPSPKAASSPAERVIVSPLKNEGRKAFARLARRSGTSEPGFDCHRGPLKDSKRNASQDHPLSKGRD
jgi:hypothetical protein